MVGVRSLSVGDDDQETVPTALKAAWARTSGASGQVLSKFASMGRALEL